MKHLSVSRFIPFFLSFFSTVICVTAQDPRGKLKEGIVPSPAYHYLPEYIFDAPTDEAAWNMQKPGMHVSFASTDRMYFRSEVPMNNLMDSWKETGWRGERLNVLILVWSTDSLQQIRVETGSLINDKGKAIYGENIHTKLVRYVVSNYPYNATNATCDVAPSKDIYLMPDRLESADRVDLPKRSVRPIWLTVNIPANTDPGTYRALINVKSSKETAHLKIEINVQPLLLPPPSQWSFRLDLWQNPWVIAWYNRVEPWSPEHVSMLKKHLALYASAGGKYITTYAVHSPWQDNSYMIEETMIGWIKKKNGKWSFDYKIFDQYVQLAMDAGINKAITIYTPVPWGNRFRYLDESSRNFVYEEWVPGTDSFAKPWNAFLTDLQLHLRKKGWLDKTYLGINENTMEQTLATIKVIKAHSRNWRITYAGNWHKELDPLLNDYSFLYGNEPDANDAKARKKRGASSTYYICCNPPKPNDFLFSPPVEGRWLGWYSAAKGYDGFLRWAYDAWPADPSRDARHTLWPAGDCFLVYPGANSSTRFEKLREGISDYEKIRILKQLASGSSNTEVKNLVAQLNSYLSAVASEKEFNTEKLINGQQEARSLLERLSSLLAGTRQQR